jgi:hypothetical protein
MFEDILKQDKSNWPCYAVLEDDKLMVFDVSMIPSKTFSILRKDLVDVGRIHVNKWVCVNKKGVSVESTVLLRKLLNV